MSSRSEALASLCRPEHLDIVTGLLLSSDVRIAVPCAVLSKGANGTGSKVVVTVVRSQSKGPALALDCGQWWRGAPAGAVYMDYRQLLSHANDDALRSLHRKLRGITHSRLKGLARTQSVPGRLVFDELSGSSGCHGVGGGSAGSRVHRTSSGDLLLGGTSRDLPLVGLHRTGSGSLPPSGAGSGLRRTSSLDVPPSSSSSSSRPGGSIPRPAGSLHRLSGSTPRRTSPGASQRSDELFSPPAKCKGAAVSVTADCTTPEGSLLPPVTLAFEDSAQGRQAGGGSGRTKPPGSPGSPMRALAVPESSAEFSSTSTSSSPFGGSSPYELGSPPSPAGGGTAADVGGSSGSTVVAAGVSTLSRQPTFSQPYFAEFEDEQPSSAAAAGVATPQAPTNAAAAGADSGSVRAQQLAVAQDQMTSDELHEVSPSFNHVFVPPWAVPKPPQQQVVRAYREAGTQTSTGVAELRTPTRQTHTAADVADHFEAFMQHFAAGLPHLAMALADMHLGRGGEDPLFIKSQFYFNSLLQLKDEMNHLQERLQPPQPPQASKQVA